MTKRMLTAIAAAMVLSAVLAPVASAAPPTSDGCRILNDPSADGQYSSGAADPSGFILDLAAGDRLRMAAGAPSSSIVEPTTLTMSIDGVVVDTAAFPGVVEYVIPATGTFSVQWQVDQGNATWEVGCNQPDCSGVIVSPTALKSDTKLHEVALSGATVPDDDTITYSITSVTQDEPTTGGWRQDLKAPDANGLSGPRVSLRAERNPSLNGRVYRLAYTVIAGRGGECTGVETVGVSVQKATAVDDGDQASWNSFTGVLVQSP